MKPKYTPQQRAESAKELVRAILESRTNDQHKREFLRLALWKVTEANGKGKYKTRYKSEGASNTYEVKVLHHEHVEERSKLTDELLKNPENIDSILKKAVACTVLRDEHKRLGAVDKELSGWSRYEAARIGVVDTWVDPTRPIPFSELIQ